MTLSSSESGGSLPAQDARRIRSFVRRQGRITRGQQRALEAHWSEFGLDFSKESLDFEVLFNRQAPRVLEIGFGMGDTLLGMAERFPEKDFLGIEVYQPGVGHVLSQAHRLGLKNLRVSHTDAMDVLFYQCVDAVFDEVCLFFPDPWPKKRHHKRRIVQNEFVCMVRDRLKINGILHIATDWEEYALHILEILEKTEGIVNIEGQGFFPRPKDRLLTKFERRGRDLGHKVFDIKFQKTAERGNG